MLDRACAAVGAALTCEATHPEKWLRDVCDRVCELMSGSIAAQVWIVAMGQGEAATLHAAAAGLRSRDAAARLLRDAKSSAPQTLATAAGGLNGELRTFTRRDIISDQEWSRSGLKRAREALGVHDFARAVAPLDLVNDTGFLALQFDGLTAQWQADDLALAALGAVTGAMARGFGRRFVEPAQRRLELMRRLSDAQKQIAPLLAEGRTERAIAERLERSAHTIHEHTREIYRSFGVRSKIELRDLWFGIAPPVAAAEKMNPERA